MAYRGAERGRGELVGVRTTVGVEMGRGGRGFKGKIMFCGAEFHVVVVHSQSRQWKQKKGGVYCRLAPETEARVDCVATYGNTQYWLLAEKQGIQLGHALGSVGITKRKTTRPREGYYL